MQQTIHPAIAGNLQVIEQLEDLLSGISVHNYCFQDSDLTHSSIGAHSRHILDIYEALRLGVSENSPVDYNRRRRGSLLESNPGAACNELADLRTWLETLNTHTLQAPVTVISEISLNSQTSVSVASSVLRELVFASSHFVHHLAIIGILARTQNLEISGVLGVAPATATYLRGESAPIE